MVLVLAHRPTKDRTVGHLQGLGSRAPLPVGEHREDENTKILFSSGDVRREEAWKPREDPDFASPGPPPLKSQAQGRQHPGLDAGCPAGGHAARAGRQAVGTRAGLEGLQWTLSLRLMGLARCVQELAELPARSGWASVSSDQFVISRRGFQEEEMAQTETSWGAAVVDEWAWAQMRGGRPLRASPCGPGRGALHRG